jgi:hypothetical protein
MPYRLKAEVGAEVLCHSGGCGPMFRDETNQWLVGIGDDKDAHAQSQEGSAWECCAEARAGMERVGLVADRFEYAPFARVESWQW